MFERGLKGILMVSGNCLTSRTRVWHFQPSLFLIRIHIKTLFNIGTPLKLIIIQIYIQILPPILIIRCISRTMHNIYENIDFLPIKRVLCFIEWEIYESSWMTNISDYNQCMQTCYYWNDQTICVESRESVWKICQNLLFPEFSENGNMVNFKSKNLWNKVLKIQNLRLQIYWIFCCSIHNSILCFFCRRCFHGNKHDYAIGCEAFMEVKIGQNRWK